LFAVEVNDKQTSFKKLTGFYKLAVRNVRKVIAVRHIHSLRWVVGRYSDIRLRKTKSCNWKQDNIALKVRVKG